MILLCGEFVPDLLEMEFDTPIDNDKISMWIRANGIIAISVNIDVPGKGLLDVGGLNLGGGSINKSGISGGRIDPIHSIKLIIQGGNAGPELAKALRSAADNLDHALAGE